MKKIVDHGFISCLKLLLIMKKHVMYKSSKYGNIFFKKQNYFNLKLSRMEYKKLAHF